VSGVTGLGESLPIGRLFSLGTFLNYCSSPHFWATFFSTQRSTVSLLTKNGLGLPNLGDFPTNSKNLVTQVVSVNFYVIGGNAQTEHKNWDFAKIF
jgi:hypothetical protein